MQIHLQPISLDTNDGDSDGLLLLRDGRLLAVVSRLSRHHGPDAGRLYVEAIFGARDQHVGTTLADEDELYRWAETIDNELPAVARMRA